MRFLLVDRIVSIEPGRRIEAVKAISRTEEAFHDHFTRRAVLPGGLFLEMMAQALGRLVLETHAFAVTPFLSVAEDVTMPAGMGPGREVRIVAELLGTNPKGSLGRAECTVDGRRVAAAGRLVYGHYPTPDVEEARRRFAEPDGLA